MGFPTLCSLAVVNVSHNLFRELCASVTGAVYLPSQILWGFTVCAPVMQFIPDLGSCFT